jgi:hypothetical protein
MQDLVKTRPIDLIVPYSIYLKGHSSCMRYVWFPISIVDIVIAFGIQYRYQVVKVKEPQYRKKFEHVH